MNWTIILKNRRFEVSSTLLLRNKNDPFLEQIVKWEVDSLRQPATFGTVVGRRRSSTLPEAKIALKKGYGDCLVVCSRSHPSQLLESGRNDYGREVLPKNWRNTPEAPTYVSEIGQYEGTNSPPWQCSPACCSTDPAEAEWIGLRDSASSAIFTGPLAHQSLLFQASRRLPVQKMFQRPRWCRIGLQWLHRFQNSGFLC